MTKDDAARNALEALESECEPVPGGLEIYESAIIELRAATPEKIVSSLACHGHIIYL